MNSIRANPHDQAASVRQQRVHELPVRTQDGISRFMEDLRRSGPMAPDGDPNPDWKLYSAPTLQEARAKAVRGMRAMSAVCSALSFRIVRPDAYMKRAERAFWDAAVRENRSAVMHVVSGDALDISGISVSDAVKRSTGRARGDLYGKGLAESMPAIAVLMAESKVVRDLNFSGKAAHVKNVEAAWEPVSKGYQLAGVVDGMVFAYYVDSDGKAASGGRGGQPENAGSLGHDKGSSLMARFSNGRALTAFGLAFLALSPALPGTAKAQEALKGVRGISIVTSRIGFAGTNEQRFAQVMSLNNSPIAYVYYELPGSLTKDGAAIMTEMDAIGADEKRTISDMQQDTASYSVSTSTSYVVGQELPDNEGRAEEAIVKTQTTEIRIRRGPDPSDGSYDKVSRLVSDEEDRALLAPMLEGERQEGNTKRQR